MIYKMEHREKSYKYHSSQDPESAGTEPDGAPVVVPGVVDDLQAGSVGLDWQGSV